MSSGKGDFRIRTDDVKGSKEFLSAQDIKQSKDRINALRNSFPFQGSNQQKQEFGNDCCTYGKKEDIRKILDKKEFELYSAPDYKTRNKEDAEEEEKEKCDGSESEKDDDDDDLPAKNIVLNRIASYEHSNQKSSPGHCFTKSQRTKILHSNKQCSSSLSSLSQGDCVGLPPAESKARFRLLKTKYQRSVANPTYEQYRFTLDINENKKFNNSVKDLIRDCLKDEDYYSNGISLSTCNKGIDNPKDKFTSELKSEICNLKCNSYPVGPNVVVGNKDVLRLLSNNHLTNLNVSIEKAKPNILGDNLCDNKYREISKFHRFSKGGFKASFRSSKLKRDFRCRKNSIYSAVDEKGASDSNVKENEPDSDNDLWDDFGDEVFEEQYPSSSNKNRLLNDINTHAALKQVLRNNVSEYNKINKNKNYDFSDISCHTSDTLPSRSMSVSPIEKAPIIKKIRSSGMRNQRDPMESSLTTNSVNKSNSFRSSRGVIRKNSFLCSSKARNIDINGSFVRNQAIKLRGSASKCPKRSEYRVSLTIRPDTVANLADKFNTIISQNQTQDNTESNEVTMKKMSLLETKVTKFFSSPRASFRRKYRHKSSRNGKTGNKSSKETLKDKKCGLTRDTAGEQLVKNPIYYTDNHLISTLRSLSNSLCELNMKDLFDDEDYNKTDEEKVCDKLQTALSSEKFKGEADDSEDDTSIKTQKSTIVMKLNTSEQYEGRITSVQNNHFVSNSEDVAKPVTNSTAFSELNQDNGLNDKINVNLKTIKKSNNGTNDIVEFHIKSESVDSGISADDANDSLKVNSHGKDSTLDTTVSTIEKGNVASTNHCNSISTSPFKRNLSPFKWPSACKHTSSNCHKKVGDAQCEIQKDKSDKNVEEELALIHEVNESISSHLFVENLTYESTYVSKDNEMKDVNSRLTKGKGKIKNINSSQEGSLNSSFSSTTSFKDVDDDHISYLGGREVKSKANGKIYSTLMSVVKKNVKKGKDKKIEDKLNDDRKVLTLSPLRGRPILKRLPLNNMGTLYVSCSNETLKIPENFSAFPESANEQQTNDKILSLPSESLKELESVESPKKVIIVPNNRSFSTERPKWYQRNKSRNRKLDEIVIDDKETVNIKRDKSVGGRLYEKWNFKKMSEKNDENVEESTKDKLTKQKKGAGKSENEKSVKKKSEVNELKSKAKEKKKNETKLIEKDASEDKMPMKKSKGAKHKSSKSKTEKKTKDNANEKESEAKITEKAIKDDNVNHVEGEPISSFQSLKMSNECKESGHIMDVIIDESSVDLYGKVKYASRSRTREKREAKKSKVSIESDICEVTHCLDEDSVERDLSKLDITPTVATVSEDYKNQKFRKKGSATTKFEEFLYEPHSPTRILPPPPKTPIPPPPKSVKTFLSKPRSIFLSRKENIQSEEAAANVDNQQENIYDNIYSPDLEVLQKNRERLEEEGVKPISSFLWNTSAIMLKKAAEMTESNKKLNNVKCATMRMSIIGVGESIYGECSIINDKLKTVKYNDDKQSLRYDNLGSPAMPQKLISKSLQIPEIAVSCVERCIGNEDKSVQHSGELQVISYDEISAPSLCGYDDIRPPSVGYDPLNPSKSDTTEYDECIVGESIGHSVNSSSENRLESYGYDYDDIATYNVSLASNSYEPVCPPDSQFIFSSARKELLVSPKSKRTEEILYYSDGSDSSPHEVFSYKLTRLGVDGEHRTTKKCQESSSCVSNTDLKMINNGKSGKKMKCKKRRNEIKEEIRTNGVEEEEEDSWEELSSSETDDINTPITITTTIPMLGRRYRSHHLPGYYQVTKKSWTQGVRDVAVASTRPRTKPPISHALTSSPAKFTPRGHGKVQIPPSGPDSSGSKEESSVIMVTTNWRQMRKSYKRMLHWTPPNGGIGSSPPPCPPRPLKCSSLSSSSFSSSTSHSSSCSASSSSMSSFSPPPPPPSFVFPSSEPPRPKLKIGNEQDPAVYVTSSSTIILVSANDENNIYDAAYESSYYNSSNVSSCGTPSECHSARMRSIFYEDINECQEISCFVEGSDGDNDGEVAGHYEAIYEVINTGEDDPVTRPNDNDPDLGDTGADPPATGEALEDSFDSDDSDEAYSKLRPQSHILKSRSLNRGVEVAGPYSLDPSLEEKYLQRKYNRTLSHQPQGINKIAEVATLGMKKLRRNWTEVRTGLNKMKKKGTLSMADIKSTEDILGEFLGGSNTNEKGRWSTISSQFRRKTPHGTSSFVSSPSNPDLRLEKNRTTFYFPIATEVEAVENTTEGSEIEFKNEVYMGGTVTSKELLRRKSFSPSASSSVGTTASCENLVSPSGNLRPLSTPGFGVCRNSSSGSNYGNIFRPTNPPPAPPTGSGEASDNDEDFNVDISIDTLASRLNQILMSGPVVPPGRKVLYSSPSCSTSDVLPLPALLPQGEKDEKLDKVKGSSLRGAISLRQLFPSEVFSSCALGVAGPRNRSFMASSFGSSEGYIHPSVFANSPPPLPARPTLAQPTVRRASTLSCTSTSEATLKTANNCNESNSSSRLSSTASSSSRGYLGLTYDPGHSEEVDTHCVSSHFADEPLYQFYTAKVERAALYQGPSSEDDYEVINNGMSTEGVSKATTRPSAMDLVTPSDGRRTLWCELLEVVNSGILETISNQEKKSQEAMFEVITSEASYLKSLNVLVSHFMNCPDFTRDEDPILSRRDRNILFSDILAVKVCSEMLLCDLEKRWQESFRICGITDIILKHATSSFSVYVKYCSNQIYQDRKLRDLKDNNPRFVEVLTRLETSPVCQSLAMQSFLMLPMQRVTRLPLLIDAIFNRLQYGSTQWQQCKIALASLQKIVVECNEAARKMERMEEMLLVSHQLDFREVKAIPLISASRWLVKKGELTRLISREGDAKLTFGRKISKHMLYFFLFTDLLVVTKKKSDDQHMVLDYCPRNMVQVMELENADRFPGRVLDGHKNLIIMTMLQNYENKTVEMVLSCHLESERSRWMEAVTPRTSENPDERIYEEWDCPQVQAIHTYTGEQPDELSLEVSDVFNVLKKTSDGWYQGERLRDGARGWFPGNHTAEIASAHVRARNLRQRYRLLAISSSIVDELRKEKDRSQKEEKKKDRRRTVTLKETL